MSRATNLLGVLGLASSVFVVVRLAERWHVAPSTASHQITLIGQRLSYPTANFAAVIVLLLGVVGLAVIVLAGAAASRELTASIRFGRRLTMSDSTRLQGVLVFEEARPSAFCAGLLRPKVYVSTGALMALDERALQALLLHEQHHAHRRDPLRLATGRVLSRSLFFVPGIGALVRRHESLAELGADEWAIGTTNDNRAALARAMLTFSEGTARGTSVGVDPVRVDHVLGEPPNWRFPALVCGSAVAVLVLLAATGLLASQVASGSATLAPPFLSNRPCIVMLALVPAAAGLIVLRLVTRPRP